MTPLQTASPHFQEFPPSCTIVPAEVDDLEPICRFDELASRDYRQRDFVATAIEEGRCWVAFFEETPVAYGIFNYQFQGYGVIHRVFVSPAYRRRGIGRALVDYFGTACSSPRIYVTVPQQELAMLELLRTRGFRLSGAVQEYGDQGAALIYVKDLLTATPPLKGRGLQ
jgi:GNAT superfamily N-acetyltransferase